MTFLGSLPVLVFGYVSGLRIIFAYRAWAEAVAAERFKARLRDMLKTAAITGASWAALGAPISWAVRNA